jgi:cytoskeleton protein RodZ
MASAGSHLHALREQHGVSLEELAQATRINPRFLEALEADDFAALPAGPFAKGFIRSYCQALRESAERPLALYAAASAASAPRRETAAPPRGKRSLAPVLVSLVLLVILGVALAAVTIALRSGRGDGVTPRDSAPVGVDGPRARPADPR